MNTTEPRTPYSLTLTLSERKAIDWIGYRDWNGDDLEKILSDAKQEITGRDPDDFTGDEWSEDVDITFKLTEAQAWDIQLLYENGGNYIPHFASDLVSKVQELLESVV